jgi:NitT/TauT family transport system substrate-binding protein
MNIIKQDRAKAASVYLKRDDAKLDQGFVEQVLASPDNRYETTPVRIMKYVEFLRKTKALRRPPGDWHELFLPLVADKTGS